MEQYIERNPPSVQTIEDLNEYHYRIFEHLAPERVIRIRNDHQGVNPRIEKCKKRRDRFFKKYKKHGDGKFLINAKLESKKLKKIIRNEAKWTIQKKATSSDPKAFWNVVRNVQGKQSGISATHILENGKKITDQGDIANRFACFFSEKLEKLTKDHPKVKCVKNVMDQIKRHSKIQPLTEEEILKACKLMKSKMSMGSDGIPTRVVKYSCQRMICTYVKLLNSVLANGMPDVWKLA